MGVYVAGRDGHPVALGLIKTGVRGDNRNRCVLHLAEFIGERIFDGLRRSRAKPPKFAIHFKWCCMEMPVW